MKAVELRDLDVEALGARERDLADQLFRMRIQKSMGQLEAPLKALAVNPNLISTIAEVTFYGHAQAGRRDRGGAQQGAALIMNVVGFLVAGRVDVADR